MDWNFVNCYCIRKQSYPEHHNLHYSRFFSYILHPVGGNFDTIGDSRFGLQYSLGSYLV